ncbi:Xylose isomerase-like TIM barrel [Nonlabens sp. Hel1_33_55]|uniref:sugar phosphate isomerase/epimerase family protein n=1 Tax=Nonlabens sp. Hel1_33_55 TaxID=1336802 RepID=UPI000875B3CB|nr:TIM barrel protein [Nonlabens sp. Hel1_33_55]SCX99914.1 Xylose isomerase-like TIM barrel [Nonlabens sp. Hel1_33_55]
MIRHCLLLVTALLSLVSCKTKQLAQHSNPFDKSNLIPWSIVAFDSLERTPAQRVAMIKRLGFDQYAFGGRQQHIDRMVEEIQMARANDIKIPAVWLYLNHNKDTVGKLKPMSEQVFAALRETGLQTEIWVGFHPEYFDGDSDDIAFAKAEQMIRYLAQRADSVNCKLALYNHGGWYGKARNQLEIIKRIPEYDINVVYNFHHAHDDLSNYESNIDLLLPYLSCVNLNGMKADGPKIMTIGDGDLEEKMIQYLFQKGYKGPFGILGHVKGGDPERILMENFRGLSSLR